MKATEPASTIGKKVSVQYNGLAFDVTIRDVKRTYGRVRYLVEPVAGNGQAWVESFSDLQSER